MPEWQVEHGIGESRALLVDGEEVLAAKLRWTGELANGDTFDGKLLRKSGTRGMAVHPTGREVLVDKLPRDASEGASYAFFVTRAAMTERGRFKLSDWDNCLPHQRLNHCPKSSGITKKDNLHRNIKRLVGSFGKIFDFVPTTFVLPNEYLAFAKAFADGQDREEEQFWICKPSDSSRGRGIFIISHISQVAILL